MEKRTRSGVDSLPGDATNAPWSRTHLVLFRFVFCFLSFYTLDLIAGFFTRLTSLRTGSFPISFTGLLWTHLIPWVGQHLVHLPHPVTANNQVGQDSPYEFILRGTQLALSLTSALIWTVVDPSRRDYRTLNAYLRVFVRAMLASEMLYYGLAKVPPAQFGVLSLYRQARPVGELWPMAMLWVFMAASPGYTLLCGLVETSGGLLLLARRTAALGALVSLGAMANVLALNIFYDVNQKARCLGYLLLALYLAAPQLSGLWNLVVRQRPTAPCLEPKPSARPALRIGLSLVPALFAAVMIAQSLPADLNRYNLTRHTDALRGPNYGIWRTTSFTVADPQKPLLSQLTLSEMHLQPGQDRWSQLILDAGNDVYFQMGNGHYNHVVAKVDGPTGDTVLLDSGDPSWQSRLHFQRTSPATLTAKGTVNGNPVTATFILEGSGKNHPTDPPRWFSEGRRW